MTRTRRTNRLLTAAAPTVLLAVLLTGCGSDGDDGDDTRVEDTSQAPSSTASPSDSPTDEPTDEPTDADPGSSSGTASPPVLLHDTAVGGETSDPVRLDSAGAISGFVSQFTRPDFAQEVTKRAQAIVVPDGQELVGAVVAVGCDVPPGVTVSTSGELTITAQKVASPLPECLAPVTTVALVVVDAGLVG